MSREQVELARLAREERELAWLHVKRLPARVGNVLTAFPRRHPWLAMGTAAWFAMSVARRRYRKSGRKDKQPSSWLGALAAVAVRVVPNMLQAVLPRKPGAPAQPLEDGAQPTEEGARVAGPPEPRP